MSGDGLGEMLLGAIFLIVTILALLFGSNEPAMQTDNAAILMTAMIIIGIIMIANGQSKRKSAKGTAQASSTSVYE